MTVAAAAVLPLWAAEAADSATPAAQSPAQNAPEAAPSGPGKVVKVVKITGQAPTMRDVVVVRDAETGEMRAPTAAEWSRMSVSVDPLYRSDIGLEEMYFEDGTVGIRLGDRFHSMTMVQRSPGGQLNPTCTHDAQRAVDVLTGAAPAKIEEQRDDQ